MKQNPATALYGLRCSFLTLTYQSMVGSSVGWPKERQAKTSHFKQCLN